MSEQTPVPSSTPCLSSWFVAGVSTAFVLLALYLGEMIARGYYFARLETSFRKSFSAATDLTFAVDNPEFAELFSREQKQIKLLRPLISLISQSDGVKAAAYWKRQTPPKSPLHSRLAQVVTDLDALAAKTESQKAELERLSALETSKSGDYVQLKSDFRSYLGLENKNRPEVAAAADGNGPEPAESSICMFYHGGMLSSLPVLASLPDEILDFRDLGRYFTLAKPGVPTPSTEAAAKGLADLRVRGLALQSECDEIKRKTAEILSQQNQNEENQKRLLAESHDIIRKILFTLAQPEIDHPTAVAYDLFRASVNNWGWELPELWT